MSLYKGTDLISGHQVLYSTTGQNTDGAMTQKSVSDGLDSKVSKTGDTMTGGLGFSMADTDRNCYLQNTGITKGTAPSSNTWYSLGFYDKDGVSASNLMGFIGTIYYNTGQVTTTLRAYKPESGSTSNAQINVGYDVNGNPYFSFPKCTTQATTTSSASDGKVAVVIANYVSGTSWYRIWSDGWCEQGGQTNGSVSGQSITFLKKFKNTNYGVSLGCLKNENNTGGSSNVSELAKTGDGYTYGKATTGMYISQYSSSTSRRTSWMAFGYLASGQY